MHTRDIPKTPDKRRAWIKYQLELLGLSYADLARQHGLTRNAVQSATTRPYPKMERVIATALGRTVQELWPERFDEQGLRLRKQRHRSKSRTRSATAGSRGGALGMERARHE